MASVSDHSSAFEKIDKEEKSEEKIMEPEKVPPPKESAENPKSEPLACESEVKIKLETTKTSEPVVENIECKSGTEKSGEQGLKAELAEEKPEYKEEILKDSSVKDVEFIVPKDAKDLECKVLESAPLVEEKSIEQPEVTQKTAKEIPIVEAVKDVDVDATKDKVEDSKLPTEVKSDVPEVKAEEKDVECYPSGGVSEKIGERNEEKEPPAKESVEKVVQPGKIEAESEIPKAKTEENIVHEKLDKSVENPVECASGSVPPSEEKEAKEEVVSKDITQVVENLGKTDAEANKTNVEKEKGVDEVEKTDTRKPESAKQCEEPKTSQNTTKEYVPVKIQKLSHNIIKKVKHSLVKAKKAIIRKSQNSKSSAVSEPNKG